MTFAMALPLRPLLLRLPFPHVPPQTGHSRPSRPSPTSPGPVPRHPARPNEEATFARKGLPLQSLRGTAKV